MLNGLGIINKPLIILECLEVVGAWLMTRFFVFRPLDREDDGPIPDSTPPKTRDCETEVRCLHVRQSPRPPTPSELVGLVRNVGSSAEIASPASKNEFLPQSQNCSGDRIQAWDAAYSQLMTSLQLTPVFSIRHITFL
jgi:hypothetical protein